MLNKEEIELVKSYEGGTRAETLDALQRVLPHITDVWLAGMVHRTIRELQSMTDAEFVKLISV